MGDYAVRIAMSQFYTYIFSLVTGSDYWFGGTNQNNKIAQGAKKPYLAVSHTWTYHRAMMDLKSPVVISHAFCSFLALCPHSLMSFTSLPVAVDWVSIMKLWLRNVKPNENVSCLGIAGHWSSKVHNMHKFCKFIGKTLKWMQFLGFCLWVVFCFSFHLFTALRLCHVNVTKII